MNSIWWVMKKRQKYFIEFDFDEWMQLAEKDIEAFEARRQQRINELIDLSPGHARMLKGLQFRLDMERRRHRSPMKSCLKLYRMMLDFQYDQLIFETQEMKNSGQSAYGEDCTNPVAEIIPFTKLS